MPKAYIIHGFIGAGKTTFAKKLEIKTGAKRFTPDEIIAKRYGRNLTIQKEIREANIAVKAEIWAEIKDLISNNKDVILDYGFWTKKSRDFIIKDLQELGATPLIYEILCDAALMKKRALNRDIKGNNKITAKLYDTYHKRFEPLEKHEKKIIIWTSLEKSK